MVGILTYLSIALRVAQPFVTFPITSRVLPNNWSVLCTNLHAVMPHFSSAIVARRLGRRIGDLGVFGAFDLVSPCIIVITVLWKFVTRHGSANPVFNRLIPIFFLRELICGAFMTCFVFPNLCIAARFAAEAVCCTAYTLFTRPRCLSIIP